MPWGRSPLPVPPPPPPHIAPGRHHTHETPRIRSLEQFPSINKQLITYAATLINEGLLEGTSVETIDLHDYEMPIYSIDREQAGGIPQHAQDFFAEIGRADAVLISFAEHNGFYTAAYKNVFDWASRIDMKVYQAKPAVLLSTSTGPGGGRNVLETAVRSGQFFGYDLRASLSIPSFYDNFDTATTRLTNAELDDQLREALSALSPASESRPRDLTGATQTTPGRDMGDRSVRNDADAVGETPRSAARSR